MKGTAKDKEAAREIYNNSFEAEKPDPSILPPGWKPSTEKPIIRGRSLVRESDVITQQIKEATKEGENPQGIPATRTALSTD